jgi:cytochrome c-type biogenesis protein CcmH
MTPWIVFSVIAAVAVLVIALPLARRWSVDTKRDEFDLEVFRRQLAEVDTDRERGAIDETEAASAKLEIERRILSLASDKASGEATASPRWRGLGVALILIAVPGVSLVIYGLIGAPGAPDRPLAERAGETQEAMPEDVDAAITQLADKLIEDPDNLDGWLLLARSLAFRERYEEAATAFASAAALAPDDDDIVISYGEALAFAAGGKITPAAQQQFDLVLARNPKHEGARYFTGMKHVQAGDLQAAFDVWSALALDAPADAPWLPGLAEQVRTLAADLGIEAPEIEVAEAAPEPAPPAPGPNAADMEMATEMTPEEQQVAINSMVARLEGRLIDNPDDADGWKRLGRAKRVLEDLPGAREAYGAAVDQAPEDMEALSGLAEVLVLLADPTDPVPAEAVALYERMLALDARQPDALWFLGVAAARAGRGEEASDLWSRLLVMLPQGSDEHRMLSSRIEGLSESE